MLKKIDSFGKNVIIVLAGTSLLNFFNLVCQLLIAHRFNPADFAAFNSLLALCVIIAAPFGTLQPAITKYIAEFHARGETEKIRVFLSALLKISGLIGVLILCAFYFTSPFIAEKFKLSSVFPVYMLGGLISLACVMPVFSGAVQGRELFGWFSAVSVTGGLLKLGLIFIFIILGFGITGAIGAFLIASAISILLFFPPLKDYFVPPAHKTKINFKELFFYLVPVAVSYFCFMVIVSSDMIMVKYYFSAEESGTYAVAQVIGKIFMFLPGAINMVMFPRTSSLHAKNLDTTVILKRSLLYAAGLCGIAAVFYNLWPQFSLNVLTGKAGYESAALGRMFSFSMTLFALVWIMVMYFLSKRDFRFISWLVLLTFAQISAIVFFHATLFQVQAVLCAVAILLFCVYSVIFFSAPKRKR